MKTLQLTSPSYEPVSLAEARRWCRLEADDTINTPVLTMLVRAMREHAEHITGRAFIQRTYRSYLDCWPAHRKYGLAIELPHAPLVTVDSFKYTDTDGNLQDMTAANYVVHTWSEPGIIVPAWNVTWPTVRQVPGAIQVAYTAGYPTGSPPDEASQQGMQPDTLRLWMQARISTLFENREQLIVGSDVRALPRDFVDGLLDPLVLGQRLF